MPSTTLPIQRSSFHALSHHLKILTRLHVFVVCETCCIYSTYCVISSCPRRTYDTSTCRGVARDPAPGPSHGAFLHVFPPAYLPVPQVQHMEPIRSPPKTTQHMDHLQTDVHTPSSQCQSIWYFHLYLVVSKLGVGFLRNQFFFDFWDRFYSFILARCQLP